MISFFGSFVKNLFTESVCQRTLRELNSMSNHQLSDIGITRADIERVARQACEKKSKPNFIEVHP